MNKPAKIPLHHKASHNMPQRICTLILLAACLLAFFVTDARADCLNPPAVEGTMIYNVDEKVMQFCNGDDWKPMANGNCALGGGSCTNPEGVEGEMIYNGSEDIVQFCNGVNWVRAGGTCL